MVKRIFFLPKPQVLNEKKKSRPFNYDTLCVDVTRNKAKIRAVQSVETITKVNQIFEKYNLLLKLNLTLWCIVR